MSKYIFLRVFVFSLLAILGGIYLSSLQPPQTDHVGYPWQIEQLPNGQIRVFSLTLGQSSLDDAQQLFKETAEITLFMSTKVKQGNTRSEQKRLHTHGVEAFFSQIKAGGLNAKMVMAIDVPENEIKAMYNRGVRIATLGSGTRKVTLSDADALKVRALPISSITYLPSVNLKASLIEKRFGQPAEKRPDPVSDAIHWLYPERGLDVVLSETNKEVIQYVEPNRFNELLEPLKMSR